MVEDDLIAALRAGNTGYTRGYFDGLEFGARRTRMWQIGCAALAATFIVGNLVKLVRE